MYMLCKKCMFGLCVVNNLLYKSQSQMHYSVYFRLKFLTDVYIQYGLMMSCEQRLITKEHIAMHTNLILQLYTPLRTSVIKTF